MERHYRRVLLAAIALGLLVAMLGVGRVQAAGPPAVTWAPAPTDSWQYQLSGRLAVNEQCFQYNECEAYQPFLSAGKAVLNVEYALPRDRFCSRAAV